MAIPKEPPFIAFVGNLPLDAVQSELEHIFTGISIVEVRMMRDRETDKFRGFAFVEFQSATGLEEALAFNGAMYDERALKINIADSSKNRQRNDARTRGRDDSNRGIGFTSDRSNQRPNEDRGGRREYDDRDQRRFDGGNRRFTNRGPSHGENFANRGGGGRNYPNRQFRNSTDAFQRDRNDRDDRRYQHDRRESFQPDIRVHEENDKARGFDQHFSGEQRARGFPTTRSFYRSDMHRGQQQQQQPRRNSRGNFGFDRNRRGSSSGFRQNRFESRGEDGQQREDEQGNVQQRSRRQSSTNYDRPRIFVRGGRKRGRSDNQREEPSKDTMPSNDPNRPRLVFVEKPTDPEELAKKQAKDAEDVKLRQSKLFEVKPSNKSLDSSNKENGDVVDKLAAVALDSTQDDSSQHHVDDADENSTQATSQNGDEEVATHPIVTDEYGPDANA